MIPMNHDEQSRTPGPAERFRRPTLSRRFDADELAFFCKLEYQIEQKTRIPVRFRLGSVDYVDYLEGKREDYKLRPTGQ